ncbi:MAG: YIP1 family protein [Anaerolineales bacterium]|nr:YIP1 family protein [Anaerolineales bacterium]
MIVFVRLWKMLVTPRRTCQVVVQERNIRPAVAVVLGFSTLFALSMLRSYLNGDYPPEPATLKVWVDAWGEFAMVPVLKIPAEYYRLFLAIILIPLGLAIWMLMAGTGKLFSMLFMGKGSYEQYLNLFGFSFFVFWILSTLLDMLYSGFLGTYIIPALQNQYGPTVKDFFLYFPQVFYPVLLGLGGVYNGIAIHTLERFSMWKTSIAAFCTFIWPILLISTLIR